MRKKKYLSSVTSTARGLPLQKYLSKNKTPYLIIRGKNISRFEFQPSGEYLPPQIANENKEKVSTLSQPKIISQRIIAHVTQPREHLVIMSALDKEGFLNVDTVENTFLTDQNYSLEFLLCLFNSTLVSWFAYRYIYSNAIRTMDFDNYYVGKIPLPKMQVENAEFKDLATKMTDVCSRLNSATELDKKQAFEEEKRNIFEEIDNLVYKTYGLSPKERDIVTGSLK